MRLWSTLRHEPAVRPEQSLPLFPACLPQGTGTEQSGTSALACVCLVLSPNCSVLSLVCNTAVPWLLNQAKQKLNKKERNWTFLYKTGLGKLTAGVTWMSSVLGELGHPEPTRLLFPRWDIASAPSSVLSFSYNKNNKRDNIEQRFLWSDHEQSAVIWCLFHFRTYWVIHLWLWCTWCVPHPLQGQDILMCHRDEKLSWRLPFILWLAFCVVLPCLIFAHRLQLSVQLRLQEW